MCHPRRDPSDSEDRGKGTQASDQAAHQIVPARIPLLYQADFPGAVPAFDLLFARDSITDVSKRLVPNQDVHIVAPGEAGNGFALVLLHALRQVIGYADIKRAIAAASQHVNEIAGPVHPPGSPSPRNGVSTPLLGRG